MNTTLLQSFWSFHLKLDFRYAQCYVYATMKFTFFDIIWIEVRAERKSNYWHN